MNSASEKVLAALEAELSDLRPRVWTETAAKIIMPISAPLAAVARAAMARPWWRGGFEDDAGFDIWRCDGCDAPKDAPGDYAPHREPCRYSPMDAALDALEAAAEGVV